MRLAELVTLKEAAEQSVYLVHTSRGQMPGVKAVFNLFGYELQGTLNDYELDPAHTEVFAGDELPKPEMVGVWAKHSPSQSEVFTALKQEIIEI